MLSGYPQLPLISCVGLGALLAPLASQEHVGARSGSSPALHGGAWGRAESAGHNRGKARALTARQLLGFGGPGGVCVCARISLGFEGFIFAKYKQCLPSTWPNDSAFGMGAVGIR